MLMGETRKPYKLLTGKRSGRRLGLSVEERITKIHSKNVNWIEAAQVSVQLRAFVKR
jgi:hypothetical protein